MKYQHVYYSPEHSDQKQATILISLYPETAEEMAQLRTISEKLNSCSIQHTLDEHSFSCIQESEKDFRVDFTIY